ncbi:MAG: response regulator [Chromatiales bacterium]|nr:response regulator [Chromatiales bacterium]
MPTVLIVDDQSISRMILEELIRSIDETMDVESYADPIAALDWAKANKHDLVITDYKMPNMDGVEFTHWLRQIPSCADVPVVIITSVDDKAVRYKALEAGATDFLSKPIDHYECRARCRNLLKLRKQQDIIRDRARWLENEVKKKTTQLHQREKEILLRLAKAGEYRDEETGGHVCRTARYSYIIAKELGFNTEYCEVIQHAAPMHDIGKIGIPDQILLKPAKLTVSEWETMQTHTLIGYEILKDSSSEYLKCGATIALGHHERFDGKGYPNGLAGQDIPIEARIAAVADVFDALRSQRPYKQPWPIDKALDYLRTQRGKHFDNECIDAFLSNIDEIMVIENNFPDQIISSGG